MSRVILVTGATGALSGAISAYLAERGDSLMLVGRDEDRLREAAAALESDRVAFCVADVSDPESAQRVASETVDRFGRLDGLVHTVGSFNVGPVMLTDPAAYEDLLQANLLAAVIVTQAVLPHLRDGGRLVYFGTPLSEEPLAGMSAYAASKAALTAWVRSLAHEVKQRGIHANMLSLTLVDTPAMRRDRPGVDLDQTVAASDVARAVGFLTDDSSNGLYGSVLPVTGKFGFTSSLVGGPPAGGAPGQPNGKRGPGAAPLRAAGPPARASLVRTIEAVDRRHVS